MANTALLKSINLQNKLDQILIVKKHIKNLKLSFYIIPENSFRSINAKRQLPIFTIDAFPHHPKFSINTIWRPFYK